MHPGKLIVVHLLVVVVLLHSMSMPLVYLGFQLNREYIAANLCINRDKPITVCGGRCYLVKNLKKAHDSPKSNEAPAHRKQVTETLYYSPLFSFACQNTESEKQSYFVYIDTFQSTLLYDIFHPPKA